MSRSQRVNFPTLATPRIPTSRAHLHVMLLLPPILSDNGTTSATRVRVDQVPPRVRAALILGRTHRLSHPLGSTHTKEMS